MRRTKDEVKAELYSRFDQYKIKRAARRKHTVICLTFVMMTALTLTSVHMTKSLREKSNDYREMSAGILNMDKLEDNVTDDNASDYRGADLTDTLLSGVLDDYKCLGSSDSLLVDFKLGILIETGTYTEQNISCSDAMLLMNALGKFELSSEPVPEFVSPVTITVTDQDGTEYKLLYEAGDVIYLGNLYTVPDGGAEINGILKKYNLN